MTKYLIFGLILIPVNLFSQGFTEVEHFGALKNFMHQGDLSAKVELNKFKNLDYFYAIGATENLKGEVQIFNSEPLNSSVSNDELKFDTTYNSKAALLVCAQVKKWTKIPIPPTIVEYEQLETFIKETALIHGIKLNAPFPFLIEGTLKSFEWHVINWKDGDTEHTHEKHITSGLHGNLNNREVEMLGFYSDSHHAIFTHHSTNMHIHVKTKDKMIAGHLDGLTLGEGMLLMLPN